MADADGGGKLVDGPIGYAEALAELEAILDELEADTVDVDQLAARVRRARELVDLCKDRITTARMAVTEVVADSPEPTGP
jgi:exodeoxyribonuclease VII small subunit